MVCVGRVVEWFVWREVRGVCGEDGCVLCVGISLVIPC